MILKFVLLAWTSPRVSDPVLHLNVSQAGPIKNVPSWVQYPLTLKTFPSDSLSLVMGMVVAPGCLS